MDVANASIKIAETTKKIIDFIDRLKEIYDNFAKRINKYIKNLEKFINDTVIKINSGLESAQAWINMKLEDLTSKIQDALDNLKKKVDGIIDGIRVWYNNVINSIKIGVIKAVAAKLGQELDDDAAAALADAIPHPDITTFLPKFNFNIHIPEFNLGSLKEVSLKRLPLFEEEEE